MNRRFIPFHFDLSPRGYLGDKLASNWVSENLPEFSGSLVATPPVVFVTPDGKIVGRVSNYAPTDDMLAKMHDVLREHPEYAKDTVEQKRLTGVARARMLIDLQQYELAIQTLANDESQQAQYLLGRLYRMRDEPKKSETYLARVTQKSLLDDVRMERAQHHWAKNEFDELGKLVRDFPVDSNRYSEARYFEGLAWFHLDDRDRARKIWADLIAKSAEDRWVYRADWAYSESKSSKRQTRFSSSSGNATPLGRIGYMGADQPDLKKRN